MYIVCTVVLVEVADLAWLIIYHIEANISYQQRRPLRPTSYEDVKNAWKSKLRKA